MSLRQNLACHITPVFLRLALAVTFIWAGLGKVMERFPVEDRQTAETLVEAGALDADRARLAGLIPPAEGTPTEDPEESEAPQDAEDPEEQPADEPADSEPDPAEDPQTDPDEEDPSEGSTGGDTPDDAESGRDAGDAGPSAAIAPDHAVLLASDTDGTIEVLRVHGLSMLMASASETRTVTEDDLARYKLSEQRKAELVGEEQRFPLVPGALGNRPWPVALAWAAAITEIVAGLFLLIGFLTRLSGLGVAGVMIGAIWLTEFGPAIQSGATVLGFLPAYEAFSPDAWKTLLWQFALLMMALGVTFSGAGGLSLDRVLFGPVGGAADE